MKKQIQGYEFEIVRDVEEGGFALRFPSLPGCLTCGDTEEEAVRNAEDALKVWLSLRFS